MEKTKSPDLWIGECGPGQIFGDLPKYRPKSILDSRRLDDPRSPEQIQANETAKAEAKKELGIASELIEPHEVVEMESLRQELSMISLIDGMIDRCIKRLLMVRGIKSLAPADGERGPASRKLEAVNNAA